MKRLVLLLLCVLFLATGAAHEGQHSENSTVNPENGIEIREPAGEVYLPENSSALPVEVGVDKSFYHVDQLTLYIYVENQDGRYYFEPLINASAEAIEMSDSVSRRNLLLEGVDPSSDIEVTVEAQFESDEFETNLARKSRKIEVYERKKPENTESREVKNNQRESFDESSSSGLVDGLRNFLQSLLS